MAQAHLDPAETVEELRKLRARLRDSRLDAASRQRVIMAVLDLLATVEPQAPQSGRVLVSVKNAFDLSDTELAQLMGVSRQAITSWVANGVPAKRAATVANLASIAEILTRRLRPGLVPGVARRPADAYGGRTMLEVIAAGEDAWLLRDVQSSFDYGAVA